jgi:hypothetical protein
MEVVIGEPSLGCSKTEQLALLHPLSPGLWLNAQREAPTLSPFLLVMLNYTRIVLSPATC